MPLTIRSGTEKYRLTPEKLFITASKSGELIRSKAKIEFLIDQPPENIAVESNQALPFETKTARVTRNSYMLQITIEPEKLQALSTGMLKGVAQLLAQLHYLSASWCTNRRATIGVTFLSRAPLTLAQAARSNGGGHAAFLRISVSSSAVRVMGFPFMLLAFCAFSTAVG